MNAEVMKKLLAVNDTLNDDDLQYFFGITTKQPVPNTYPTEKFVLVSNTYFNKANIETTVGKFLWNKFAIPEAYLKKYGYQNQVFDSGNLKNFEAKCAQMILHDEMTVTEYVNFMDRGEWLCMDLAKIDMPGLNSSILKPIPEVINRKNELVAEYGSELSEDQDVMNKVERELVDMAKEKLQNSGDPAFDYYSSGEFGFSNNYKKASICNGVMRNPVNNKLMFLKSNYIDGTDIREYNKASLLTLSGAYSRGVDTQKYGYLTKQINNGCSSLILDDDPNSDCGTTKFLEVVIPKDLGPMFYGRWVLDGSKLVNLNAENINRYTGVKVLMRSPLFCTSEHICSKCAGTLFYDIGIKNIGVMVSNMSGAMLNLSLKAFHDSEVKFTKLLPDEFISEL